LSVSSEIFGLVLAGGRSRRMGRDKAAMIYRDGRSQVEVVCALIESVGVRPFVSLRVDQESPAGETVDVVHDAFGESGPVGAIASAQAKHPDCGWLVVACDLPLLNEPTLRNLLEAERDCDVICFSSEHDGRPEPLCALWLPDSSEAVRTAVAAEHLCARRLLEAGDLSVRCLESVTAGALDNANTPDEAERLQNEIMK